MLRDVLAERAAVGTFLKLPRAEVVEVLALAGLDFAVCDMEHGQLDERDAREVLLASRVAGLPIVVRVTELDRGLINRLLEAGAAGIQLARVRSRAGTAAFADLMRYPPEGSRSLSQAQPAAGYGREPLPSYLRRSNDSALLVGQIETADNDDPLTDVLNGLDVAFIGTLDLSVDVGAPGQLDAPAVATRIRAVEQAARETDTPLGVFAATPAAASAAVRRGYRYVAVAADLGFLRTQADAMVAAVRGAASS